jgi:hypothetical protein
MVPNENLEVNRILNSMLRILVESYEQTAAHSSLMIRDSDLRAGERYLTSLSPETKRDPFYMELMLGTVLAIGLQAVIDKLPSGWLSDINRFIVIVSGLALAIGFLCLRWWFFWRPREAYQDILSSTFRDISDAYSAHSALSVRLQRDRQLRVALEAILLPLSGKTWEEIARARYLPEVQSNIDRIAQIDRQRMLDMGEYDRKGGDFWLELLQATLHSELPGFVCTYLDSAKKSSAAKQRCRNLRNCKRITSEFWPDSKREKSELISLQALSKWRKEAKRFCNALYGIDKRFSGNRTAYQQLLEVLDGITEFSEVGLDQLLAACKREPFNYAGPRANPPFEFFSQAGFVPNQSSDCVKSHLT